MLLDEMALRAALRGDNVRVKEILTGARKRLDCPFCESSEVEIGFGNSFRCCDCGEQWER